MYLLGYDIGSSSVKVALVDAQSGMAIATTQQPKNEMEMIAHQSGWAEQNPEDWWTNLCMGTKEILAKTKIRPADIKSIGIAYQMHGLVLVDKDQNVLRPSIIWCDSRAVEIGNYAFDSIGQKTCLSHLLNSPGNFTASKLSWVKQNEPELYERVDKIMLPGDYIAMKLTGEISTTISGLSEGVFWDFKNESLSSHVMDHFGFETGLVPSIFETFSKQGSVTQTAAQETGLAPGIPVSYRAGDQPNNALSLGVFETNEVAATGGTSGVIYAVVDKAQYDDQSRVNGFAHVNHTKDNPRVGILLCINGTGIQYAWVRQNAAFKGLSYPQIETEASSISIGSDGLCMLPFGNGAERVLGNKNIGAHIHNLEFNIHNRNHLYRAALEGIAFSFYYGFKVLKEMGLNISSIKVGNDNLFQSQIFSATVSTMLDTQISVIETTGAIGAAQGSGVGAEIYSDLKEAVGNAPVVKKYEPNSSSEEYKVAYQNWESALNLHL